MNIEQSNFDKTQIVSEYLRLGAENVWHVAKNVHNLAKHGRYSAKSVRHEIICCMSKIMCNKK